MAKESAIMVQQECIELVDRSIPRSAHIAGQIFSVQREEFSFMGKPVKDLPMWVTQWESDSTNQHGPLLLLAFWPFSHAKKGDTAMTNNVAFMTPIFLFLSIWFFFSLCWIFRLRRLCRLYTGECVCIHTHRPYKQWVRLTDSLFLLLLRWGSF